MRTESGGRVRTGPREPQHDDGSAIVEFLGVGLLLLVPLVYLIVVLAALQGASFAVEAAARDVARVFVTSATNAQGETDAWTAAAITLGDHGLAPADLRIECPGPCLDPGTVVQVHVAVTVPLPWVPDFVQTVVPLAVTVTADQAAQVGILRSERS